jgi:hypothetical protein
MLHKEDEDNKDEKIIARKDSISPPIVHPLPQRKIPQNGLG